MAHCNGGVARLLEQSSNADIHGLLARIRTSLYLGDLVPGDRLPSVRDLARQFRVSPNAVLDLYRALEADGLVEARRRSGVFVRHSENRTDPPDRNTSAFKLLASVAKKLSFQGLSPTEFSQMRLRYTGMPLGDEFRLGVVGCGEQIDLVRQQLISRVGPRTLIA